MNSKQRSPVIALVSALWLFASPASAQEAPSGPAAPTTTATSATSGTPAAPASGGTAAEEPARSAEFNRQLLTIEEDVHALKEQVFRSKATLQLLKEIVVQGSTSGARATIWHENRLGRAYTVESIAYYLDGQGKFSKADASGALNAMPDFKVFEGGLPPGNHTLTVNLRLRGNGLGVFSYVQDYTVNVQASTAFAAEEGKTCTVRVTTNERKGIGRSFVERPEVVFQTRCVRTTDAGAAQ
jgi:hypothetical protein